MRGGGVARPANLAPGWHWLYTCGHDLAAPAGYAFRWMGDHAPSEPSGTTAGDSSPSTPETRTERRVYPRERMVKVTRWEFVTPDRVTFHDYVYQRGALVVEGEERYRFLGGDGPGCIVEVPRVPQTGGLVEPRRVRALPRAIRTDSSAGGRAAGQDRMHRALV